MNKVILISIISLFLVSIVRAESINPKYKPFDNAIVSISTFEVVPKFPSITKISSQTPAIDRMPLDDGAVTTGETDTKPESVMNYSRGGYDVQFPIEEHKGAIIKTKAFPVSSCTEKLINAQVSQDILHFYNPLVHFDNCRIKDSIKYISSINNEIDINIMKNDYEQAATNIGKALHTIHDFYSHTNYVELMANEKYNNITNVPVPRVWEPNAYDYLLNNTKGKLVSGSVWYEPGNSCSKGSKTHAEMNKDKEAGVGATKIEKWGITYHQAALNLAERASNDYMNFLKSKSTKLFSSCGKLQYVSAIVNRDEPFVVNRNEKAILNDARKKMSEFLSSSQVKYDIQP